MGWLGQTQGPQVTHAAEPRLVGMAGTDTGATGSPSGEPNGLFRKITVRKAQNRLRYSDLVAVKARDFFGETSPRTFETRGVISSYCFLDTLNMSNKVS